MTRSPPPRMYFELDTTALDAAQAACIALPAAGVPRVLHRFTGGGWALVAPLSIVLCIGLISFTPAGADVLAWVSLLLVPVGCGLALGWAAHAARPWLALLTVPVFAAALAAPDDLVGQLGRIVLIAGSCITVGRLLAAAAPLLLLKAGVVAMALIDSIVIFGDLFDEENAQFATAAPSDDLPQLHIAHLGGASIDYGDFFQAGLVGGILAAERRPQLAAAVAMVALAQLFNQLFLVVDSLPGTVPPAIVLLGARLLGSRRTARRPRAAPA